MTTSPGVRVNAPPSSSVPKWRSWLLAARPATLPAAFVPVCVGSGAAYSLGHFRFSAFLAAFISALFIQIGTNIANDLFDFKRGADTTERLGPTRVTQAGLLSPQEVAVGMWVSFGIAFFTGLYLVWLGGWPILAIGLISIVCGIAYTAGPFPLAYNGLGDVFSFLFFGVIAVGGTYYVHALQWNGLAFWVSLPVALLVTAILVVNNYRDLETDRKANKRTLAVRLGARATRWQFALLIMGAYGLAVGLWITTDFQLMWLPVITLPLGIRLVRSLFTLQGSALNAVLKGTGQLHLFFGLLLTAALVWGMS